MKQYTYYEFVEAVVAYETSATNSEKARLIALVAQAPGTVNVQVRRCFGGILNNEDLIRVINGLHVCDEGKRRAIKALGLENPERVSITFEFSPETISQDDFITSIENIKECFRTTGLSDGEVHLASVTRNPSRWIPVMWNDYQSLYKTMVRRPEVAP